MLANHTGIATLFKRILTQYNALRKRTAFLESYKREPMFEKTFDEFDDAKEVVQGLIQEYEDAEKEDYLRGEGEPAPEGAEGDKRVGA
jgi:tubulin gamma